MTSSPSLSQFRDEMRRLAAVIGMPENYLASCGEPARGGYDVALGATGYVLTYREKGDTEIIIESQDANAVMERLFVVATANWAPTLAGDDDPVGPGEVLGLLATSAGDLGAMAMALHANTGKVQEQLLGQLNPTWQKRQAFKNAHRAQSIRDAFDQ